MFLYKIIATSCCTKELLRPRSRSTFSFSTAKHAFIQRHFDVSPRSHIMHKVVFVALLLFLSITSTACLGILRNIGSCPNALLPTITGTATPKSTGKAHENRRPTSVLRHGSSCPLLSFSLQDLAHLRASAQRHATGFPSLGMPPSGRCRCGPAAARPCDRDPERSRLRLLGSGPKTGFSLLYCVDKKSLRRLASYFILCTR